MHTQLIVYACPTGPLAGQIEAYFAQARTRFSYNPAHDYMPHVTLTGFFPDIPASIPHYLERLQAARQAVQAIRPEPPLMIINFRLDEHFHGLELASPWLIALIRSFIASAESMNDSPTRPEAIRPKEWLHLSLAYAFPPTEHAPLKALAESLIDPAAPVAWQLRLYERAPGNTWTCHGSWAL